MIKKLLSLLLLVSLSVNAETTFKNGILRLDGDNFFSVSRQFDDGLADEFLTKLFIYDKKEMFIYFDSPGGDVISMLSMTRQMQNSPIKFICVAKFAASAAFMMFQYCTERYVLPDGIIMSHDASGGFQGEFRRVKGRMNAFEKLLQIVEKHVARRMELSYNDYVDLITKELWLTQKDAIKRNAADDGAANVVCSKELTEQLVTQSIGVQTLFGTIEQIVTKSACPLIYKSEVKK